MADTAHKTKDEITEHYDPPDVLQAKAAQLAQMLQASKHAVFFTGAGISTAAGIADFRGPTGVWTMRAQGKSVPRGVSTLAALPTLTHMSIVELERQGIIKYLISQNTDGLHRRSGFPVSKFSELHGNSNLELCKKCGREYVRDYRVRTATSVHEHATGRTCDDASCGGALQDTIINFGENLPTKPLHRAEQESEMSDLHVCLGSSLRVSPACDLPVSTAQQGGKLVVCNLQKTPLDSMCTLRIWAKVDDLMRLVMQNLGFTPPPFILRRRLVMFTVPQSAGYTVMPVGVDADGTPFSYIKEVEFLGAPSTTKCVTLPFRAQRAADDHAVVRLHFQGHYSEPPLDIPHALNASTPATRAFLLEYDVTGTHTWTVAPWDAEFSRVAAILTPIVQPKLKAAAAAAAPSVAKSTATTTGSATKSGSAVAKPAPRIGR